MQRIMACFTKILMLAHQRVRAASLFLKVWLRSCISGQQYAFKFFLPRPIYDHTFPWLTKLPQPKMATVVKNLFRSRAESYFDSMISSTRVFCRIFARLYENTVCPYFKLWFETSVFPVYSWRKEIVRWKVWNIPIWHKHMTALITSHTWPFLVLSKSLPRSCQSAPCSGQDHGEFRS